MLFNRFFKIFVNIFFVSNVVFFNYLCYCFSNYNKEISISSKLKLNITTMSKVSYFFLNMFGDSGSSSSRNSSNSSKSGSSSSKKNSHPTMSVLFSDLGFFQSYGSLRTCHKDLRHFKEGAFLDFNLADHSRYLC